MDNYRDFTYNKVEFAGLPDFIAKLTSNKMQWLPIQDAAVSKRPGVNYIAYDEGVKRDIFVKSAQGGIFTGRVFAGD